MLTSLIIAYFILHGGASALYTKQLDQLTTRIKKEVTVEVTRNAALALVDSADKANKSFLADQKKLATEISKVLGDRESTPAQIDATVAPLLTADAAITDKMVVLYLQLRPVLGAGDWAKVFPAPAPTPAK